MKISKEKFNKLNQLDRIEFRQRIELIAERCSISSIGFLKDMLLLLIVLTLFNILIININYEAGMILINTLVLIIKVVMIGTIFLLVIDFLRYGIYLRDKRELEEEYFNIEIKTKKKK